MFIWKIEWKILFLDWNLKTTETKSTKVKTMLTKSTKVKNTIPRLKYENNEKCYSSIRGVRGLVWFGFVGETQPNQTDGFLNIIIHLILIMMANQTKLKQNLLVWFGFLVSYRNIQNTFDSQLNSNIPLIKTSKTKSNH